MKPFMGDDFLLQTQTAKTLYHGHAAKMPIIDYHCHIDVRAIAEDRRYDNITEVWLGADHYKWRLMRANGIPEREITGALKSNPRAVFRCYAQTLPRAAGNPVYHWSHLELRRYFGIDEPLSAENADTVYAHCNARLREPDMSVRGIITRSRVETLCTSDDPAETLEWHKAIREDSTFPVHVFPSFRPDKAMNVEKPGFADYLEKLGEAADVEIVSFETLIEALKNRVAYFDGQGCRVADHALERGFCEAAKRAELETIFQNGRENRLVTPLEGAKFRTAILCALAEDYARLGWVMQLHFGCLRDNNTVFAPMGPDTGFDCANSDSRPERMAALLDRMNTAGSLPRTVLYSLNPADGEVLMTVAGCFNADAPCPVRVQVGSAWWYNDHKPGMEKQLSDFAVGGLLGGFIGMLTDSRSFLSYPRHEYFRRILCNFLGNLAENGEYPADMETLAGLAKDISYTNARRYFRLDAPHISE